MLVEELEELPKVVLLERGQNLVHTILDNSELFAGFFGLILVSQDNIIKSHLIDKLKSYANAESPEYWSSFPPSKRNKLGVWDMISA